MPRHIMSPSIIAAAGNAPKRIEEFVGRVDRGHSEASVARSTLRSACSRSLPRPSSAKPTDDSAREHDRMER